MMGASVTTTWGPAWPARPAAAALLLGSAADVEGLPSSSPCRSSSVSLIACEESQALMHMQQDPRGGATRQYLTHNGPRHRG